jgi:hypothetical protein
VIGAERARAYEQQYLDPDSMLATYGATFAQAAANGEPLRAAPEVTARAFNALQMGTLHYCHTHEPQPLSPARAWAIATETVAIFLDGALVPA